MSNVNDYFDNRELAFLVWLAISFIWALSNKNIRESICRFIKVFFQKFIIITTCLMLCYIGLMVYIFYRFRLWDTSFIDDTIVWIVGVAFVMYLNINRVNNDDFFKKTIIDNLKLIVVLEFIINLYVFNFWVELFLVPLIAILVGVSVISSSNPEYKQVESCLNVVFIMIGMGFLSYAIYNIIIDFQGFLSIDNLKEFLLPIVFTLIFLPFIYVMALYVTYDLIFRQIRNLIKDESLARYTRQETIFSFHLNLKYLNKWLVQISRGKINSKDDVKRIIWEVKSSNPPPPD